MSTNDFSPEYPGDTPNRKWVRDMIRARFPEWVAALELDQEGHVSSVTHPTTAIEDHGIPVPVTLHYDAFDPLAVTVKFHALPDSSIDWTFARQLLSHGLISEAGQGDVHVVRENADDVRINLTSPSGSGTFVFSATALTAFVSATFKLVSADQESLTVLNQIDAGLAALNEGQGK